MSELVFDEHGFGWDSTFVRWDQVQAILLRTTAGGPFTEDVFWQFLLKDGRWIEVTGRSVGPEQLRLLQRNFPSLDHMKVIEAMGTTSDFTFRLWHATDSQRHWDESRFRERFVALVGRLGGAPDVAPGTFESLAAAWSEESREYHNLEHLAECLTELDSVRGAAEIKDVAELALWFHDAAYRARGSDNEERSAEWLMRASASLRLPTQMASAAAECVRATAHLSSDRGTLSEAAALVVDVDLSILGRDAVRFWDFELSIEREFAPVSFMFFVRRGCFLSALLRQPSIFQTAEFRERYEARARTLITAMLRRPRYRAFRWLGWMSCPRGATTSTER